MVGHRARSILVLVCLASAAPAAADVLCQTKRGLVVVRTACKKKETALDLTRFGVAGSKGDKGDKGDRGDPGDPGSPDGADAVRAKFFSGTACPGNDPADIMVRVGSICVDRYEASVWNATNSTQFGAFAADYPCGADGNDCASLVSDKRIFARSVEGVSPSAFLTWFQAQQACLNAGKRLLTSAEWQMAAAGTPDPGGVPGAEDCNTNSGGAVGTGSRASCVSNWAVSDMVGNLEEWVADWTPYSAASPGWGSFSDDLMSLSGASTTANGPAAMLRGGFYGSGTGAGVFSVNAGFVPWDFTAGAIGFRCGR